MSEPAARAILLAAARALAHADRLDGLLAAMAEQAGVESSVIMVVTGPSGALEVAASVGLAEPAITGLVAAVGHPGHPIARTVAVPVASFDVLPTRPGGPALRSHLPLTVTRGGGQTVLGVLALAHDLPIAPEMRPLLQAGADLAAVEIERRRTG